MNQWGLRKKTENWDIFHFRLIPPKRNDKNLRKNKKTRFWAHFGFFRANNFF